MRVLAAVLAVAGAGPVPIPPVPTVPTVTVPAPPPLPVTVPKVPPPAVTPTAVTPPAVTAPVPTANATPAAPVVSHATASLPGAPSVSSSPSSPSSSPSSSSSGARAEHFHSSRPWIGTTGPKQRRTTTLTFTLQQAGRVVFTVNEVSPACVGMGHIAVAGRKGLNRVRFAGVVHGRRLTPGTYRISIRTANGVVVRRVTIVVVAGSAPTAEELHTLKHANTCHGDATSAPANTTSAGPPPPLQGLPKPKTAAAGLAPTQAPNLHSGVLATSVEKTARAIQPLLVALLALSIVLLGTASLPRAAVPGPRVHDTLARHRVELAGLGAAALVAVALAFLLT